MPQGRPSNVRSHRRGRPRRRARLGPWLGIVLVIALLAGGAIAGYVYVLRPSCSGKVTARVAVTPSTAPILVDLARQWHRTDPSVNGTCATVEVVAKDSAELATELSTEWDEASQGPAPDVWVPQSTAWARRASASAIAEPMMPDLQPSLARSPAVIAMPRPMAEALGWPRAALSWQEVIDKFAASQQGWSDYGKDWGAFKFGMTNPAKSTAGLLALTALLDANDDGEVDSDERLGVRRLKQVMKVYQDTTDQILAGFTGTGGQGGDAGMAYVSAFPALEQDVLTHNLTGPQVPLVAIYPKDGTIEADHPYLILNAPWATPLRQRAAGEFLSYLRTSTAQSALLDAGFRDPNRKPGKNLDAEHGLTPQLAALPRAVLLPDAVSRTIDEWTALTRRTNMLLVLDVSGSMNAAVPGASGNRLALAKTAAKQAIALFPEDARVGLWAFSTRQNGNRDYRSVVPLGDLGDEVSGGQTRQERILDRIDSLRPTGDTGLYDTTAAALDSLTASYDRSAANIIVLLTDGKNDDPLGGMNREQLMTKLAAIPDDKPVRIITVAYGEEADFAVLREISQATGSVGFTARDEFDIGRVLSDAVFAG